LQTLKKQHNVFLSKDYFERVLGVQLSDDQYLKVAKATHELALLIIETA
jgi:hypothetical protein